MHVPAPARRPDPGTAPPPRRLLAEPLGAGRPRCGPGQGRSARCPFAPYRPSISRGPPPTSSGRELPGSPAGARSAAPCSRGHSCCPPRASGPRRNCCREPSSRAPWCATSSPPPAYPEWPCTTSSRRRRESAPCPDHSCPTLPTPAFGGRQPGRGDSRPPWRSCRPPERWMWLRHAPGPPSACLPPPTSRRQCPSCRRPPRKWPARHRPL
mmetsp:Transcript_84625/g.244617  ORF Transcript_84625/g.244617 Transcript_84625/m.244617 type:complete len:211 (-) Transcript_84625:1413-2045(-)